MQYFRKLLLLVVYVLLIQTASAGNPSESLQSLVNDWNTLHNTQDTKSFTSLYSNQVLFYGKYRTGKYCVNRKDKFLNPNFSQRIISPITIQYFSSGTIKCSFVKEVTYKQVVKEHASYLLLKEMEGGYKITGESDVETDTKLNVQLNLGEEIKLANKANIWLYLLVGLGLVAATGLFFWNRKKSKNKELKEPLSDTYVSDGEVFNLSPTIKEPVVEKTVQGAVINAKQETEKRKEAFVETASNKEKGDQFEQYVVSLFDATSGRFRILDWRSDKKASTGLYPLSSHLPDLVMDYRDGMGYHPFAIECKWRSSFQYGKIDWAKEYQINNYLDFQYQEGIPVFVVIGIGGTPNNPNELFVADLQNISRYPTLFESYIRQFYKNPRQNFFFNPRQQKLS